MSDLREAAEAVLEAWDWDWSEPRNEALKERMEALRQALTQPEEKMRIDGNGKLTTKPYPDGYESEQQFRQALAKREWVGLTEEEFSELLYFDGRLDAIEVPLIADLVRAVQAKLKEKNT